MHPSLSLEHSPLPGNILVLCRSVSSKRFKLSLGTSFSSAKANLQITTCFFPANRLSSFVLNFPQPIPYTLKPG